MLDAFAAVLLGIVEGVTEFLPISSTGHLILASRMLGVSPGEFAKSFEIAIQLGAILSVFALYGRRLLMEKEILRRVLAAFVPTGIVGFILYPWIKGFFLESIAVVLWALFAGGAVLIAFELWYSEKSAAPAGENLADISYTHAFTIGIFQAVSVVPGVSRAAATIVGGMAMGLGRKAALEFSFLLAIPTMAAATGFDLVQHAGAFSSAEFGVLAAGFFVSFVTALFAIKFLLAFTERHTFIPFGVYRIVAALAFWWWVAG